jgi:hypothetical protein
MEIKCPVNAGTRWKMTLEIPRRPLYLKSSGDSLGNDQKDLRISVNALEIMEEISIRALGEFPSISPNLCESKNSRKGVLSQ